MITKLSHEHIDQLVKVSQQTFRETYPMIFSEVQFESFFKFYFNHEAVKKDIETGFNHYFGYFEKDRLLGFATISFDPYMLQEPLRPLFDYENSVYLDKLYIIKSAQKKGIGRQLLDTCIEFAQSSSKTSLWLRVWSGNENAIAFYNKLNYERIGQQYFDFEEVHELDYVLLKKF